MFIGQHKTPTRDGAASIGPFQPHGTSPATFIAQSGCLPAAKKISQGTVRKISETQSNPVKPISSVQSAVKDYAAVAFSFTTMLLKRIPDVVDTNPAKIAFGIAKLVLQIRDVCPCSSHRCLTDYAYQEVKGNIDTVDQRIVSTAEQLGVVKEAMDGWKPNNAEEEQGIKRFEMYACPSPLRA